MAPRKVEFAIEQGVGGTCETGANESEGKEIGGGLPGEGGFMGFEALKSDFSCRGCCI